jgi:hypothetical protein
VLNTINPNLIQMTKDMLLFGVIVFNATFSNISVIFWGIFSAVKRDWVRDYESKYLISI